ncbi:class III extradiol dioxygenase family protein [Rhodopseudomonas palustris]|uniref:class III extradiol dioxygenase family protein n=1 Tax=Rhodopseudomonas palustris TaxID=1076 RepID=UPI002ACE338F|nr:class III extradiol dioxygenase family protein [Rhodopseudomonas palustris]WQG98048.1 class III extradiol dioxygenase family protein [Rhodopseudomonas palustris]
MATIIGGLAASHVPAIGGAMARGLQKDPYWAPFFDGFDATHRWLDAVKPDAAVVIYNDHGLNFFLDKMPTFAVGAAPDYRNEDEGWGIPVMAPFRGDTRLSWHIIETLVESEFDPVTCQEMLVDHAFSLPMELFFRERAHDIPAVPVVVNTVQHPLPSLRRCFKLGQAIGRAIESYPEDLKVVVIGTGGLSHQLEGERAGFINTAFDRRCMDAMTGDIDSLLGIDPHELVELAGSQGVEVMNWVAMRGALLGDVHELHRNYHLPISNTASGIMLLENRPKLAQAA